MGLPTPRSSWIHGLVWFLSKIFSQLALSFGIFEIFHFIPQNKIFLKFLLHGKLKFMNFVPIWGKHLFIGTEIYYWKGISLLPEPQRAKGIGCKCHQLADFTNPLYSFISMVHTCHHCVILSWIYTYSLKWNLLRENTDVNTGISFYLLRKRIRSVLFKCSCYELYWDH